MVEINSATSNGVFSSLKPQPSIQTADAAKASLFSTSTSSDGVKISGESQYLFEMAGYLQNLGNDEQDKAVEFLSKSDDPLHAIAVKHFNEYKASGMTAEIRKSISEQSAALSAAMFKGIPRDPALGPEIAVIPMGTRVYALDGNPNYYPNQIGTDNIKLRDQLEELAANPPANLNIQENANIFGTVKNALLTSENVLQSFDDVLNFNYMFEKARATINQTNAPDDLKAKLNDILDRGIKYQNDKQTRYVEGIQKYANDSRVGGEVRENIRKATTAQDYNKDLQGMLKATKISVLDAGSMMKNLLTKHTDLIRFSPDKINDAISFYKQDFDTYQDFVKNGFQPPEEKIIEYDTSPLTQGHNYAMKVIEEIQSYVSKGK